MSSQCMTATTHSLETTPPASTAVLVTHEAPAAAEPGLTFAEGVELRVAQALLQLEVRLPIRNLRVKDILSLSEGAIFETAWPADEDLPGSCGGVQLFWTEFEVIEKRLAVRVTRLA
jgi:flagellar motor switch protein FliN/FliY